jgi:hypothetical protein
LAKGFKLVLQLQEGIQDNGLDLVFSNVRVSEARANKTSKKAGEELTASE